MKFLIAFSLLLSAQSSLAHFKIGTYKGVDQSGMECEFEIISKTFANRIRHPLNERVEIDIHYGFEQRNFIHLAIVNDDGTVRPKKEILSSVMATSTGANAYELHMNHDGPYKMTYFVDNYRDPTLNIKSFCKDLVFQGN